MLPLDEASVTSAITSLKDEKVDAVAIGLLHCYANPSHEDRVADIVKSMMPDTPLSLSSRVSPEIREYDRISTTVANAYVLPLMRGYLESLEALLNSSGYNVPLLLMMSSGSMTTVKTARDLPIRLVESGPAGGAILAKESLQNVPWSRFFHSIWAALQQRSVILIITNRIFLEVLR